MQEHREQKVIAEIIEIGARLDTRGYLAGTDGNISARLDSEHIFVTASGAAKGRLEEHDIVLVDMRGELVSGNTKPSSELLMHLEVYRKRGDASACVHSHPPYCTAYAITGAEIPQDVLPEVIAFVGEIAQTEFAPPGTLAVAESISDTLENSNAFILGNHGLLTIGKDLEQACNRHEIVESYLKVLTIARQLGDVRRLPSDEVARLKALFE
ncbi:class II aldolase/adducin family protein [Gemmatimonas aurantiaca]|nr:class II aldolase/adducin family protein [Gemmatimonas aurantiaca]